MVYNELGVLNSVKNHDVGTHKVPSNDYGEGVGNEEDEVYEDVEDEADNEMEQVTKLANLAFMCTIMLNMMPSQASKDNKTLFTNVIVTLLMQSIVMLESVSHNLTYKYGSAHKRSLIFILWTQSIGVVVGAIAPMFRCFSVLSFKFVAKNNFKVKKYLTQKLYDWKQNHTPYLSTRVVLYNLKNIFLSLCIGFQIVLVILCKVIWLFSLVVLKLVAYCFKSLEAKLFTLPINKINEDLSSLMKSVGEGLSYTYFVEESLNPLSEYVNIQKAAMTLWDEVENNHMWLKNILSSDTFEGKTTILILKWFADKAKEIFIEIINRGIMAQDRIPLEIIAYDSMYRITETVLFRHRSNTQRLSIEQLFALLNAMIADILSACFTNIQQGISMKYEENVIENCEASQAESISAIMAFNSANNCSMLSLYVLVRSLNKTVYVIRYNQKR
ncbi:hypothetical protein CTI12_AA273840 [Artemisia annua]|uniref:Uncharacterized protein n=1 Tax=Artemisia annua TaxID=35608 RepID=A0A2U1NEP6_ARTAN|nr:hypothetical protein CTI12_AA273840 [Artemisia annua]